MTASASLDDRTVSDDLDEKLFGLVEIAEQQQLIAQQLLEQLANERVALSQEREHWAQTLGQIHSDVRGNLLDAVSSSMAGIATTVSAAISDVTGPATDRVAQAADSADRADRALRRLVRWASTRILAWGLAALAGLVLLGWLASGIVLWWDTKAIAAAHVQKLQLQMEVAELRATHDAWVAAGMETKLHRCGRRKKPCVAVDEVAGAFGKEGDHRIVKPD